MVQVPLLADQRAVTPVRELYRICAEVWLIVLTRPLFHLPPLCDSGEHKLVSRVADLQFVKRPVTLEHALRYMIASLSA